MLREEVLRPWKEPFLHDVADAEILVEFRSAGTMSSTSEKNSLGSLSVQRFVRFSAPSVPEERCLAFPVFAGCGRSVYL